MFEKNLQPAGRRNAPVVLSIYEVILIGDRFLQDMMIKKVIHNVADWLINPDYLNYVLEIIHQLNSVY